MAVRTSRHATRALVVALAITAAATAVEGLHLARVVQWNQLIASEAELPAGGGVPAEVRFARAYALAKKGDTQAALAAYREINGETDPVLAVAARFNSGNVLLRQALDYRAGHGPRIPLIELAKEAYREVLRTDPNNWDARFNFERAQRLLPDPDDGEDAGGAPPLGAERAVTTMRGYTPGLP